MVRDQELRAYISNHPRASKAALKKREIRFNKGLQRTHGDVLPIPTPLDEDQVSTFSEKQELVTFIIQCVSYKYGASCTKECPYDIEIWKTVHDVNRKTWQVVEQAEVPALVHRSDWLAPEIRYYSSLTSHSGTFNWPYSDLIVNGVMVIWKKGDVCISVGV